MRRLSALVPVLGLTAIAGASAGGVSHPHGRCARALPSAPAGLPAPVVVTTGCGRFELRPDGDVAFLGSRTKPVPPAAQGYWLDLTWSGVAHRQLLIGRGMRRLWRSHDSYRARVDVGAVALGRRGLAFSVFRGRRSRLYLAGYRGAEHAIARDETPLTFTGSGGLVTWNLRHGTLLLRDGSGRVERRLAAHAVDPQVARGGRKVVFRARDRLFAFDGVRARDLGSSAKTATVDALRRLVAVHDRRRLVVLDYEGRVVSSTALPRPRRADGVWSSVVGNAQGTVAFAAPSRRRETVFVLGAGARRARPLFGEPNDFYGCGRAAWLDWRGRWLLYSDTEQRAAAVDGSGAARPVRLRGAIARMPGFRSDGNGIFDIAWG